MDSAPATRRATSTTGGGKRVGTPDQPEPVEPKRAKGRGKTAERQSVSAPVPPQTSPAKSSALVQAPLSFPVSPTQRALIPAEATGESAAGPSAASTESDMGLAASFLGSLSPPPPPPPDSPSMSPPTPTSSESFVSFAPAPMAADVPLPAGSAAAASASSPVRVPSHSPPDSAPRPAAFGWGKATLSTPRSGPLPPEDPSMGWGSPDVRPSWSAGRVSTWGSTWGSAPAPASDPEPLAPVSTTLANDVFYSAHKEAPMDAPPDALAQSPPLLALYAHGRRGAPDDRKWPLAFRGTLRLGPLARLSETFNRLRDVYEELAEESSRLSERRGRVTLSVDWMSERLRTHIDMGILDPSGLQVPITMDSPGPGLARPILVCHPPDDDAWQTLLMGRGPLVDWLSGHGVRPFEHYFPRPRPKTVDLPLEVCCEFVCGDDTLAFLSHIQGAGFTYDGPLAFAVTPEPYKLEDGATSQALTATDSRYFPHPFERYARATARPMGFAGSPDYILFVSFPRAVREYAAKSFMHQQIPPGIKFALGISPSSQRFPQVRAGLLFASDGDRGRAGLALRAQKAILSSQGLELEYAVRDMNPPPREGCYRCGSLGHRKDACDATFVPPRCQFCSSSGHLLRACREKPKIDDLLARSAATAPAPAQVVPVMQSSVRIHERVGDRERVIEEERVHMGVPSAVVTVPPPRAITDAPLEQRVTNIEGMLALILSRLPPAIPSGEGAAQPPALAPSVPGPALQIEQDQTTPVPLLDA